MPLCHNKFLLNGPAMVPRGGLRADRQQENSLALQRHFPTHTLFAWFIVFLGFAIFRPSASFGHAVLLHTEPTSGMRLDEPPKSVMLIFSERVEPVFNSVRVLDQRSQRVDQEEVTITDDGEGVSVSLNHLLSGPYAVFWRVTSVDGHQVQGYFGFGVQADAPPEQTLQNLFASELSGRSQKTLISISKWISLAALALWLGGLGFLAFVLIPSQSRNPQENLRTAASRSARWILLGALLYLSIEVLTFLLQTLQLTGLSFSRALSPTTIGTIVATTNYGHWWIIRFLSAAVLLILCLWVLRWLSKIPLEKFASRSDWTLLRATSMLLGGLILLTVPFTGHSRGVPSGVWIAVLADWLHLAASVLWIGGLLHFVSVCGLIRSQAAHPAQVLHAMGRRFSTMAKLCVAALFITGIYSAWLHIPAWSFFISSTYGLVLLVKLLLVVPILVIAGINLRWMLPQLNSAIIVPKEIGPITHRFSKLLAAEAALGLLILIVVATLTSLPPATASAMGGAIALAERSGDTLVSLNLEPNKVGKNLAVVKLQNGDGDKITAAKRVTLYVRSLDMDMGLSTVVATPQPDGSFSGELFLSMAGRWSVSIEVAPMKGDSFVTEFKISSAM